MSEQEIVVPPRVLEVPELSLVVLVGASGSGKSAFARRHFVSTEVVSSDFCRGLVADDENDQSATKDAFELLHFILGKRMAAGRLAVVDATNVKREDRAHLVRLAREYHFLPVAIVFDLLERLCHDRNRARPDRDFGPHVIRNQIRELRRGLRGMRKEGFRQVHVLSSAEEVEAASINRTRLWNNRRDQHGPFDIIGDVHGCCDELERLLGELGYRIVEQREGEFPDGGPLYAHPEGRTAVFLGDLVDRGPRILDTIRLVRDMVEAGTAHCVPGNHEMKLVRKLRGREVQITHGLDRSLAELDALPDQRSEAAAAEVVRFLDSLVSHYVYDDGKLVVAHAGMKEEMQGRGSGKVRDFALYGETTGETDEFGLPVRWNWAAEYRGRAIVVYGHTPVPQPEWLNRTINVDTGCVFGGRLTALRYPEKELVSVPAAAAYAEPARPFLPEGEAAPSLTAQQREDELLDIDDVLGKRIISTRLAGNVTIREENAIAALEVMGRFAINPKWLVYLPPAISPSATSKEPEVLEHPAEAFAYYRQEGVPRVVCEEKHMGSRTVVVVCRDETAARRCFGVVDEGFGACFTRTGRRFFDDDRLESEFLTRVQDAVANAGLFERFESDWALLDCELMPWSAKAQELLREQYAAVGAAARAGLSEAQAALEVAATAGVDVRPLLEHFHDRAEASSRFVDSYRRYCWPVRTIDDIKLAPFHLLATAGAVHIDKTHVWHMETLAELCAADRLLHPTAYTVVDTTDHDSAQAGSAWWAGLTERGGEGMVVKPLDYIARGRRGLAQPRSQALAGVARVRARHRSARTLRRGEPLRRVHECVFGVLALESEPVDPRL